MSLFVCLSIALLFLAGSCAFNRPEYKKPFVSGQIVERGLINCFEKGLKTSEGKPVYCEASAVVYDGRKMVFASDKPIPGDSCSAVFSLDYNGGKFSMLSPNYLTHPSLVEAIKYEDLTLTPDGRYVIATTGFDRIKSGSAKWNNYNTLLIWPVDNPGAVRVVSPSTSEGITSSVGLRKKISAALKTSQFPGGVPYFKIEGLAAIPGSKLLFGIRELGESYKKFDYAIKIVLASYQISDGNLVLKDDFKLIYDYDASAKLKLRHTVALSSLEYDKYNDCLYMLTSFEESETDEGIGGFLWILPIADLDANKPPILIMKDTENPLTFAHKSEGVTVLNKNQVLVIHDDDRVLGREAVEDPEKQFSRKANQAAYTVATLSRTQKKASPPDVEISGDVKAFLGKKMISIIAAPDQVESFRMNAAQDENSPKILAGFPILKQGPDLNGEQLKKVQSLIFDENSYHFGVEKSCRFAPEMGLRFIKKEDTADVLFSFSCDLWLFAHGREEKIEDCDPIREELIQLAYSLFPPKK